VSTEESTSAALRRVEQERDDVAVERDWLLAEASDELRERFFGIRAKAAPPSRVGRPTPHLDMLRAELASARTELDAVRTARDNLGRELAEARLTIRALIARTDPSTEEHETA
jgi:hypothetical protein